MNKHKKEEPIVFYMNKTRKYLVGSIIITFALPTTLLFLYLFIQDPPSFNISLWEIDDFLMFLIGLVVMSTLTIFPLATGLYYLFKPIAQVKIHGNTIYYSDMCRRQVGGGNISPLLPYTCSVEDHQFSLHTVAEFNPNSLVFTSKGLASQQNSVPPLQILPILSKEDRTHLGKVISERIKQL